MSNRYYVLEKTIANDWLLKINYKAFDKMKSLTIIDNFSKIYQIVDMLDWSGFENRSEKGEI